MFVGFRVCGFRVGFDTGLGFWSDLIRSGVLAIPPVLLNLKDPL